MKVSVIKHLVEDIPFRDLIEAEHNLIEEIPLKIGVEGEDEGEKLTHLLAAIFILERMTKKEVEFREALKEYCEKVRENII